MLNNEILFPIFLSVIALIIFNVGLFLVFIFITLFLFLNFENVIKVLDLLSFLPEVFNVVVFEYKLLFTIEKFFILGTSILLIVVEIFFSFCNSSISALLKFLFNKISYFICLLFNNEYGTIKSFAIFISFSISRTSA